MYKRWIGEYIKVGSIINEIWDINLAFKVAECGIQKHIQPSHQIRSCCKVIFDIKKIQRRIAIIQLELRIQSAGAPRKHVCLISLFQRQYTCRYKMIFFNNSLNSIILFCLSFVVFLSFLLLFLDLFAIVEQISLSSTWS